MYEEIPIAKNGADLAIAFNCRNMLDAFRALPEDVYTVRIRMNSPVVGARIEDARGSGFVTEDPDSPIPEGVELPEENGDGDRKKFIFFIMPVKMNK